MQDMVEKFQVVTQLDWIGDSLAAVVVEDLESLKVLRVVLGVQLEEYLEDHILVQEMVH
tara:strand:+ start:1027 stop:1203 length:177 start_codon:yes stop_codon:yes gene_type:complete